MEALEERRRVRLGIYCPGSLYLLSLPLQCSSTEKVMVPVNEVLSSQPSPSHCHFGPRGDNSHGVP